MTQLIPLGRSPQAARNGMLWIPSGSFTMGSEDHYPEEAPARRVAVDGFWMDPHPVTNARFLDFVLATGHVTVAEQAPSAQDYPDADPALLVPASIVFTSCMANSIVLSTTSGGALSRARAGGTPTGRARRWAGSTIIPWSISPSPTRSRSRPGRARRCRPRPNGSTRPAPPPTPSMRGATR